MLTALVMKITAVLDVTSFSLIESCQRLEEMCCLHLQGRGMHYTLNTRASGSSETLLSTLHKAVTQDSPNCLVPRYPR
jgi:hypothetical protein